MWGIIHSEGIRSDIFLKTSTAFTFKGWESLFFCYFFLVRHVSAFEWTSRAKNWKNQIHRISLAFVALTPLCHCCWWIRSPVEFERQYRICCYSFFRLEIKKYKRKNDWAGVGEKITAKPNMNISLSHDCVERYEWFFRQWFHPRLLSLALPFLLQIHLDGDLDFHVGPRKIAFRRCKHFLVITEIYFGTCTGFSPHLPLLTYQHRASSLYSKHHLKIQEYNLLIWIDDAIFRRET